MLTTVDFLGTNADSSDILVHSDSCKSHTYHDVLNGDSLLVLPQCLLDLPGDQGGPANFFFEIAFEIHPGPIQDEQDTDTPAIYGGHWHGSIHFFAAHFTNRIYWHPSWTYK